MGDLFASLNEKNISISESLVTSNKMAQLIDSINTGVISGRTAKEVFEIMKECEKLENLTQVKCIQAKEWIMIYVWPLELVIEYFFVAKQALI